MMLLLIATAWAQAPCQTPGAMQALRGERPAHPGMLRGPRIPGDPGQIGAAPGQASQLLAGRQVNGTPYALHRESEHFSINWFDEQLPIQVVNATTQALEGAWTAFVEEQGWPEPVSSQDYYIWVLLDAELGTTTGYTTEYFNEEFPQGYPIVYLNPDWADSPAFYGALSAHEFMHTIQYAMRDWNDEGKDQSWYWEASANYASELADPDREGYQYTSAWYADEPQERYDSYIGGHEYGMFVLNAYLEQSFGSGTMKGIWQLSQAQQGVLWDALISEQTQRPPGETWAAFSAAYANEQLSESAQYQPIKVAGTLAHGNSGTLRYLGSHPWAVDQSTWVRLVHPEPEQQVQAVLGNAAGEQGAELFVRPGELFTVTGLEDGALYVLELSDGPQDSGDTGAPQDSGDTGPGGGRPGCGCSSQAQGSGAGFFVLILLGAVGLRRRGALPKAGG